MSPAGSWFLAIAWLRRLAWPKQRRRWSRPRVHQSTTAATGWTLAAAADGMASLQCEAFPSLLTTVSSAAVGVTPSAGAVVATTCFTHPMVAQAGSASTGYCSAGEGDPTCMVTLTASPVLRPFDWKAGVNVAPTAAVAVAASAVLSRYNASKGCASASQEDASGGLQSLGSSVSFRRRRPTWCRRRRCRSPLRPCTTPPTRLQAGHRPERQRRRAGHRRPRLLA